MNDPTPLPLDERRLQIIRAATGVFLRYGFARTTMGDIAADLGLSRPSLYQRFPDKAAIFRAVVETMVADKLAELRQGLTARTGLAERLEYLCTSWTAEGYDLVCGNPDAKDMFDLGFEVVRESYAAFEALLAEELSGQGAQGGGPDQTARMMGAAMKGFKDLARDGADLRAMIRSLVATVVAAQSG